METLLQHLTADFLHLSRQPLTPRPLVLIVTRKVQKSEPRPSPRYIDHPANEQSIIRSYLLFLLLMNLVDESGGISRAELMVPPGSR